MKLTRMVSFVLCAAIATASLNAQELVEFLVRNRGTAKPKTESFKGPDHSQKRTPIRNEVEAVGHAGHGNYLYSGVVDVYSETCANIGNAMWNWRMFLLDGEARFAGNPALTQTCCLAWWFLKVKPNE